MPLLWRWVEKSVIHYWTLKKGENLESIIIMWLMWYYNKNKLQIRRSSTGLNHCIYIIRRSMYVNIEQHWSPIHRGDWACVVMSTVVKKKCIKGAIKNDETWIRLHKNTFRFHFVCLFLPIKTTKHDKGNFRSEAEL